MQKRPKAGDGEDDDTEQASGVRQKVKGGMNDTHSPGNEAAIYVSVQMNWLVSRSDVTGIIRCKVWRVTVCHSLWKNTSMAQLRRQRPTAAPHEWNKVRLFIWRHRVWQQNRITSGAETGWLNNAPSCCLPAMEGFTCTAAPQETFIYTCCSTLEEPALNIYTHLQA